MKKRRTYLLVAFVVIYIASYCGMRFARIYVHGTGTYDEGTRHKIQIGNLVPIITAPAIGILYIYYPLKTVEEIYWSKKESRSRE